MTGYALALMRRLRSVLVIVIIFSVVIGLRAEGAEPVFINLINGHHLRLKGERVQHHRVTYEASESIYGIHHLVIDKQLIGIYVGTYPKLDNDPNIDELPWSDHPTADWRFQYWETEDWLHLICNPNPYRRDETGHPNQGHRPFVIYLRKPTQFTVVNIWTVIDVVHDPKHRYRTKFVDTFTKPGHEKPIALEFEIPIEWQDIFFEGETWNEIKAAWAAIEEASFDPGENLTQEDVKLLTDRANKALPTRYTSIDWSEGVMIKLPKVDE